MISKMRKVWTVLLGTINLMIIGLLTGWVTEADNCKAPIVLIFCYLVLVAAHLGVWGLLALFKSKFTGLVGNCVLFLALMFLPVLLYASS